MAIDPYRGASGQLTAEEEIAGTVITQTLPTLNKALAHLMELQQVWLVNELEDKIAAAANASEPLAGYSAADWYTWGEGLRLTFAWLDTPQPTLGGKTMRQVFIKRYTRVPEGA